MLIRTTYDGVKRSADYTCTCGSCGKTLKRKVVVEHTVNPFNKNEAGEPKTRTEVGQAAQAEAIRQAAEKQGSVETCRDCDEAPNRELLLAMAAEPDKVFPQPERYWSSPMHVLADRKQVEAVYEKCTCGAPCCSGYINRNGYRITKLGRERAAKLIAEAERKAAA